MKDFTKNITDRFIRYTTFDTMSDSEKVGQVRPTTPGQIELLKALVKELEAIGADTYFGKEMVVRGYLPATDESLPTIGFMAHVDTADDVNGNNVKAIKHIVTKEDITLPTGLVIAHKDNPDLIKYLGEEVITSSGDSLLGSDDKAGVAVIMEALEYLVKHPEIKRGAVEVFFTPDEETGSGMDEFPYDKLESVCCYTIDGAQEGEVECECFNAATVNIKIFGESIHLGSARGKLVNAVTIASQIVSSLPQAESPEATDGRYGYYCPLVLSGTQTEVKLQIFIRDFDLDNFNRRIENVKKIVDAVTCMYNGKASADVHVSYHNMAEVNKKVPKSLEAVMECGKKLGIDMFETIIRGGTDGARLAEAAGVPCPNIFTGGHNLHALSEWVSVSAMNKAANLVLEIINYWAK